MAIIYKISNDVNNKIYIGQTTYSLEFRYKQHLRECEKKTHRKLYIAMNEIGIEHFKVETIENCNEQELDEREKYWIRYYNSYKEGYNMTIGGNGGSIYDIDDEEVNKLWNEGLTVGEIAKKYGCRTSSISQRLSGNPSYSVKESIIRSTAKPVYGYDLKGLHLYSFSSAADAERFFTSKSERDNVAGCCRGDQKTAHGIYWSYEKLDKGPVLYQEPFMVNPIIQLDKNGKFIQRYESIADAKRAMKQLGHKRPHIDEVCKHIPGYKTTCGFIWRYAYDDEFDKAVRPDMQILIDLLDD
jgi:group I intron endonuclease|nr:MAG TPA: intron associated endonuclease [Caudoviricetes sp.]